MKTRSVRTIPFLATITVPALVTPCSAAGKEAMMTMPHSTKDNQIPNSRQMNF